MNFSQILIAVLFTALVYFINELHREKEKSRELFKRFHPNMSNKEIGKIVSELITAQEALKYVKDTNKKLKLMQSEVNSAKEQFDAYLIDLEGRIRKTLKMYYDSVHSFNKVLLDVYDETQDIGGVNAILESKRDEIAAIYAELDKLKTIWPEFYGEEDEDEA